MADRETKTEAELIALVLQTVRDAGFAWVEAGQAPIRCEIRIGRSRTSWARRQRLFTPSGAQYHPTVAELQERYVLKRVSTNAPD
jgi:hypothetical protein